MSCKEPKLFVSHAEPRLNMAGKRMRIVAIDCGIKANIIRYFMTKGVELLLVPWDHDISKEQYDGLFVSNGPGDPTKCAATIKQLKKILDTPDCGETGKPVFGICLGNQLLALAAGCKTYKMKYGNRGANQPCIDTRTNRCYITAQNHGMLKLPWLAARAATHRPRTPLACSRLPWAREERPRRAGARRTRAEGGCRAALLPARGRRFPLPSTSQEPRLRRRCYFAAGGLVAVLRQRQRRHQRGHHPPDPPDLLRAVPPRGVRGLRSVVSRATAAMPTVTAWETRGSTPQHGRTPPVAVLGACASSGHQMLSLAAPELGACPSSGRARGHSGRFGAPAGEGRTTVCPTTASGADTSQPPPKPPIHWL